VSEAAGGIMTEQRFTIPQMTPELWAAICNKGIKIKSESVTAGNITAYNTTISAADAKRLGLIGQ
jgi:hypothetical protein